MIPKAYLGQRGLDSTSKSFTIAMGTTLLFSVGFIKNLCFAISCYSIATIQCIQLCKIFWQYLLESILLNISKLGLLLKHPNDLFTATQGCL